MVGAIGVSGNTPQEDEDIAKAGAAALAALIAEERTGVSVLEKPGRDAAFAKAACSLAAKTAATTWSMPAIVRCWYGRNAQLDTDIIYVLEGAATLVTGGTVEGVRTTAPQEIRGRQSRRRHSTHDQGRRRRRPNGTPHWFKDVRGPFDYYVVKVR